MSGLAMTEEFDRDAFDERLRWLNPPPYCAVSGSSLVVRPAARTDFWQRTHYGFQADSGHFLHLGTSADFECATEVEFHPVHQYDQAGLMVRVSPECWIKTSVEYEPEGPARLGVVVTNTGYSDWSTQDIDRELRRIQLRIERRGRDYTVAYRAAGVERWSQLRLACLLDDRPGDVSAGLYACSPAGEGYEARFDYLRVIAT